MRKIFLILSLVFLTVPLLSQDGLIYMAFVPASITTIANGNPTGCIESETPDFMHGGCIFQNVVGPITPGSIFTQTEDTMIIDPGVGGRTGYGAGVFAELDAPIGCNFPDTLTGSGNWQQNPYGINGRSDYILPWVEADSACDGPSCYWRQSIYWFGGKFAPDKPFTDGSNAC